MTENKKSVTWRDSVLKPKQVKFSLTVNNEDENLNLIIPLDQLFEMQAEQSFAAGIAEALVFVVKCLHDGKKMDDKILKNQMEIWGLNDRS